MKESHMFIFVPLCLTLFVGQIRADDDHQDSFPDIFQHMLGKNRFRFYYELNWFDRNNQSLLYSKLVDEAYSFVSNSGRLLVNDGITSTRPNEYNIFHWFSNSHVQESFWLKPFICLSVRKEASASPAPSGLLFSQDMLYDMLSYKSSDADPSKGQFVLQGLAAILANTIEQHSANLHRMDDVNNQPDRVRWLLDTRLGYWLEFDFEKGSSSEELTFEHIIGLSITIYKSKVEDGKAGPGLKEAQLTVLRASYQFPDSLIHLPRGYSCHHTASKPPLPFTSSSIIAGSMLNKYIIEVTVTKGIVAPDLGINQMGDPRRRLHEPLTIPEPSDSMVAPVSTSSLLTLIVDRKDNILSVLSRAFNSISGKSSAKQKSQLSVWDLGTKRYHKLSGIDRESCKGPVEFRSSLQIDLGDQPVSEGIQCHKDSEQLVIQLSESLGVRLTASGLKWLTFELQDRQNTAELVDFIEVTGNGEYEISYEAFARDLNLCLFDLVSGTPVDFPAVRLLTRYRYLSNQNLWIPKSSSLQFFDLNQSQLIMQLDLNLAHQAPYRPWTSERHQIDLSGCKKEPRQSGKLSLDYPLGNSERLLINQIQEPHELIREAIFAHFKSYYQVTLARIPSIAVDITEDLVSVQIELLDQTHLMHDSELLEPIRNISSTSYTKWLSTATRSILVNSLKSCAEYCQTYRCEVYVYCKYSISCYIYSAVAVSQDNFGTTQAPASNLIMGCDAYKVLASRSESDKLERKRAITWGLDEILESVQQSVNNPIEEDSNVMISSKGKDLIDRLTGGISMPTIRVTPSLKADGSRSDQLLRLVPTFAHYKFDNPNQHVAANYMPPNPFKSGKTKEAPSKADAGFTTNFKVVLGGQRLVEKNEISVVKHHDQFQHLDLDDTAGYLSVEGYSIDECLRLCLTDTGCASVSYCLPTPNSHCLVSRLNSTGLERLELAQLEPDQVNKTTEAGGLLTHLELEEDPACTIMMRTFSDQFERLELKMMFTYLGQSIDSNVLSIKQAKNPEDCATNCALHRLDSLTPVAAKSTGHRRSCLSYDFCHSINSSTYDESKGACILYNRHLVSKSQHLDVIHGDHGERVIRKTNNSVPGDDIVKVLKDVTGLDHSSSFCWHFVRNFVGDFHKINVRKLDPGMRSLVLRNFDLPEFNREPELEGSELAVPTIEGSDISLAKCARLCEEDLNCGAFEFCALSHPEVPGGLYLSCTIGSNETLAMIPVVGTNKDKVVKPPQRYIKDMLKLERHKYCSVYIYKALSMVAGHKKKNLCRLQNLINEETNSEITTSTLLRFDIILFVLFFLFGLVVRDLDLRSFTFTRLHEPVDEIAILDVPNIDEMELQPAEKINGSHNK